MTRSSWLVLGIALVALLASLLAVPYRVTGDFLPDGATSIAQARVLSVTANKPVGWAPKEAEFLRDRAGEVRLLMHVRADVDTGRLAVRWGALAFVTALALVAAGRSSTIHTP